MTHCRGIKKETDLGIIGFKDEQKRLIGDFIYIFGEKLNLGKISLLDENSENFLKECEHYVCCTYDRKAATRKLKEMGLIYKRDYHFAEEFFVLLNDWEGRRIAFIGNCIGVRSWMRSVVVGFAAIHGKILSSDRQKDILRGHYHLEKKNESCFFRVNVQWKWICYFLLGAIEFIAQVLTKGKTYERYDHICFYNIPDALKFKKIHPSVSNKVTTIEEVKTHTMAPLYMRAVYFDRRQNACACVSPFHVLWMGEGGTTRLCNCPEFLNVGIGNIGVNDCDKVWNSTLAKIIRLSVINNTYTFCSRTQCGKFKSNMDCETVLERKEMMEDIIFPKTIIVGCDRVCNLHCPSCRKAPHVKNNAGIEMELDACKNVLLKSGWLDKAERLFVGAGGETFISNFYKWILYVGEGKRNNIVIMTNGTLFTSREWTQVEGKYESISFSVSIDAFTKDTYDMIRCGGNFKRLMENMEFLSKLRKEGKVQSVEVNMIVQNGNYKEIPDFIRWAKRMGFDSVNLSHIRNWGTYTEEWFENHISMFDRTGEMKEELKMVLKDPVCRDPIVYMSWEV